MMDYIFISFFQFFGVLFAIGQTLKKLDDIYPADKLEELWKTFWDKDRITVFVSGVIWLLHLSIHAAVDYYNLIEFILTRPYYLLINFALALVLGYGGQWLIYQILGKAVDFVKNKVDKKLQ
jgi:hypothetical protein